VAYDEITAISCVYTKYTGVHLQCMLTKLHKKNIHLNNQFEKNPYNNKIST
jgi:hypothetical protein